MEYSNGIATAGLTTGIIGTALGVANGGLRNWLGGNNYGYGNYADFGRMNNFEHYVTKDELNYVQEIGRKDAEIALLKSEQNTEVKIADVYERLITRINADAREQAEWNTSQSVANARMSSAIATNRNSIEDLEHLTRSITRRVVPISAICPEPMARYNSWAAPTTTEPEP